MINRYDASKAFQRLLNSINIYSVSFSLLFALNIYDFNLMSHPIERPMSAVSYIKMTVNLTFSYILVSTKFCYFMFKQPVI